MKAHHIRVFQDYGASGYPPSGYPVSYHRQVSKHLAVFNGLVEVTTRPVIITSLGVEEFYGMPHTRRLYSMRPISAYYVFKNEFHISRIYITTYIEESVFPEHHMTFSALAYGHYADNEDDAWSSYVHMQGYKSLRYLRKPK